METVNHPTHYGGADNPYEAIKECSDCKKKKELREFGPDKRTKDGKASKCRDCVQKIKKYYYLNNPEKKEERRLKNAEAGKAWYYRNVESQKFRMK